MVVASCLLLVRLVVGVGRLSMVVGCWWVALVDGRWLIVVRPFVSGQWLVGCWSLEVNVWLLLVWFVVGWWSLVVCRWWSLVNWFVLIDGCQSSFGVGRLSMVVGGWRWSMVDCRRLLVVRPFVSGQWLVGCWSLDVNVWLLLVACYSFGWLLDGGPWLFVDGGPWLIGSCWSMAVSRPLLVVGHSSLVLGGRLLMVGGWLLLVGWRRLVAGC